MTVVDVELEDGADPTGVNDDDTADHPRDGMTYEEQIARYGDFSALLDQTLNHDDTDLVVTNVGPADSNLTRRDGGLGYAKLINVYRLDTKTGSGDSGPTLFRCRFCQFLDSRKGAVVHHTGTCPTRSAEDAAARPVIRDAKRMYLPADFRDLTVAQLLELHRTFVGQDYLIEKLRQDAAEERRLRKLAERNLDSIRKALGVVPASST